MAASEHTLVLAHLLRQAIRLGRERLHLLRLSLRQPLHSSRVTRLLLIRSLQRHQPPRKLFDTELQKLAQLVTLIMAEILPLLRPRQLSGAEVASCHIDSVHVGIAILISAWKHAQIRMLSHIVKERALGVSAAANTSPAV